MHLGLRAATTLPGTVLLLLVGCSSPPVVPAESGTTTASADDCGEGLRSDLRRMARDDQAGRSGGSDPESDRIRTERLKVVIERCGWPGIDLVGGDGEDAAWLIAQHSDQDPAFQAEALELLRTAVEEGDASPGNLAYLEDRVLVGRGEEQVYGTQLDCGPDGPTPAVGLVDPETVDDRRAAAGLESLDAYYESLGPDFCGPAPAERG